MILSYPLQVTIVGNFDTSVRDSVGEQMMYSTIDYLKSMDFLVYTDKGRTTPLYRIKVYPLHRGFVRWDFLDSSGKLLGGGRRKPLDMLQRNFEILDNDVTKYRIRRGRYRRSSPDSLLARLPVLGTVVSHWPLSAYLAERVDASGGVGATVMRMGSRPSLLRRMYEVEKLEMSLSQAEEERILLGFLTVTSWLVGHPSRHHHH